MKAILQKVGQASIELGHAAELALTLHDGVATMSSLDIVAYINHLRKEEGDFTELQHKDFLEKVMKVLKNTAAKFSATAFYQANQGAKRSRPIYNFPERETMLMVMSYSYDMQAKVFDAPNESKYGRVRSTKNKWCMCGARPQKRKKTYVPKQT